MHGVGKLDCRAECISLRKRFYKSSFIFLKRLALSSAGEKHRFSVVKHLRCDRKRVALVQRINKELRTVICGHATIFDTLAKILGATIEVKDEYNSKISSFNLIGVPNQQIVVESAPPLNGLGIRKLITATVRSRAMLDVPGESRVGWHLRGVGWDPNCEKTRSMREDGNSSGEYSIIERTWTEIKH